MSARPKRPKCRGTRSDGNAARHYDATGHPVTVHIARRIIYGNPAAPPPGQTTIPADDLTPA